MQSANKLPKRSSSSPPSRSKHLSVTFQQEHSHKPFCAPPLLWKTDQQSGFVPTWSTPQIRSLYLDSERTNKTRDMNSRDPVMSQVSLSHALAETDPELESHTDRLLRLTRDLYEATHCPDVPMQFFEMRQEERSPTHRLMNSLLEPKKQETRQTQKQQLKTKEEVPEMCAVLRTLLDLVDEHWNGQFSLHLNPNFMAKAILLLLPLANSVPPSQPEDRSIRGRKDEQKGKQERGIWWDMEKSRQVKSRLGKQQGGKAEWKSCEEHQSDLDVSEVRQLRRQLAKSQQEQELLKTRLILALKENFILQSEKMKLITSLESDTALLDFGVYLDREKQVLQQQDKLLKQIDRTLRHFQDNHRSLVSQNDFLHNVIKRTSKCKL